jgi:hypothetical protein
LARGGWERLAYVVVRVCDVCCLYVLGWGVGGGREMKGGGEFAKTPLVLIIV